MPLLLQDSCWCYVIFPPPITSSSLTPSLLSYFPSHPLIISSHHLLPSHPPPITSRHTLLHHILLPSHHPPIIPSSHHLPSHPPSHPPPITPSHFFRVVLFCYCVGCVSVLLNGPLAESCPWTWEVSWQPHHGVSFDVISSCSCVPAGAKRLQALSTLVVTVLLLPWAMVQLATQTVSLWVCTSTKLLQRWLFLLPLSPPPLLPSLLSHGLPLSSVSLSPAWSWWLTITLSPLRHSG